MDEKLYKAFTASRIRDRSAEFEKKTIKVSPFLMPLPRVKVLTLYAMIYLVVILSLGIVFYFDNTDVAGGIFLFGLAMVLVVRKNFCDQHYLKVLFEDNTLIVQEDLIEIPAILTETQQRLTIPKHKIKKIVLPWNIWYYSTLNSTGLKRYHLFSIVIELSNHTVINIPPNGTDRRALICQLVKNGYELTEQQVELQPVKDFQNYFSRPVIVVFSCLIVYGIYTLFKL